jgi:hypothetical protein
MTFLRLEILLLYQSDSSGHRSACVAWNDVLDAPLEPGLSEIVAGFCGRNLFSRK